MVGHGGFGDLPYSVPAPFELLAMPRSTAGFCTMPRSSSLPRISPPVMIRRISLQIRSLLYPDQKDLPEIHGIIWIEKDSPMGGISSRVLVFFLHRV
jgi:hypothetical protein